MRNPTQRISLLLLLSSSLSLLVAGNNEANIPVQQQQQQLHDHAGDTCENDTQCENGGVCSDPNDHHPFKYCHCAVGFAGIRCHTYCPLECQNGGYCRYHEMAEPHRFDQDRDPADYVCQCFGLFEGRLCEIPYMNCGDGKRCYNGGICHQQEVIEVHQDQSETTSTESFCDCPRGYGGPSCQSTSQNDNVESSLALSAAAQTPPGSKKTGALVGIMLCLLLLAMCSWYFVRYCWTEEIQRVDYSAVEVVVEDNKSSTKLQLPPWRNIV